MPRLIPEFTLADIDRSIQKFEQERIKKCFEVLSWVGIECVNFAKKNGSYTDQTGNLRSSVGYAVIFNGEVKKEHTEGKDEGQGQAKSVIGELARQYPTGMVLVVVAGMEYAAAVESKAYDVITGSSYEGDRLMKFMKEKLGAYIGL